MRILHCKDCNTIDELPDFLGDPSQDGPLHYLVERHPRHTGKLYRVPVAYWLMEEVKHSIIAQIKGGSTGLAAFDASFYDTRNTFQEDAMTCYQAHNRPKEGCPEFRTSRKSLLPDTAEDRKEAGLDPKARPKSYLCDYCPVRSHYEHKRNEESMKKGLL